MLLRVFLVGLIWAAAGAAQTTDPIPSADFDVGALVETLPDKTLKKLTEAPDRFIEDATNLILGFGRDEAIGAQGLQNAIDIQRAGTRASVLRRLLAADLNGDAIVTAAEVRVLVPTRSAGQRARLYLDFKAADTNGDQAVSWGEMRAFAQTRALASISGIQADVLRDFLSFDLDGDGRVHVDEIVTVVKAMRHEV